MLIPNTKGQYSVKTGYDKYGEPKFDGTIEIWPCAVVTLYGKMQKTPLRAEASASRSSADEDTEIAKILIPASYSPAIGARFVIFGVSLRFTSVMPRINTAGRLDHYECTFEAWPLKGG